jgi:hypothetical protein
MNSLFIIVGTRVLNLIGTEPITQQALSLLIGNTLRRRRNEPVSSAVERGVLSNLLLRVIVTVTVGQVESLSLVFGAWLSSLRKEDRIGSFAWTHP